MMMLISLAASVVITHDNSSQLLGTAKHPPVLVALLSDYCPHCRDVPQIWRDLESIFGSNNHVMIATITCDHERRLCSRFPDALIPTIWWVRSDPENAEQYIGAVTLSELSSFVEKQMSPSVVAIPSDESLDAELRKHRNNSIFLLRNLDPAVVADIRNMSADYEHFPCHFFVINSSESSPQFANFFLPTNRTVSFEGSFARADLRSFIEQFVFPPISYTSQNFFTHAKTIQSTVLILADEPPYFESELVSLTPRFPAALRCGVLFCSDNPRSCRRFVIPSRMGPMIFMHNPSRRLTWYYRGSMNGDSIVTWVHSVLNGQVRAAGPGAGFLGFIGNLFDAAVAKGKIGVGLLVALFFVFVMVFALGIAQTIRARAFPYQKLD
jgi:thiol-disulfide isomerase/thioredoxin